MTQDDGRSPLRGSGCQASPSAAVASSQSGTPNAWEFHFEAPSGRRVLRSRFIGITAGFGDPDTPSNDIMWWDCDNRRWIHDSAFPWGRLNPERDFTSSSSAPCRSFAAFKRHLRKHTRELGGRRVRLVSRFVGHDIIASPASAMSAGTAETAQQAQGEARQRDGTEECRDAQGQPS